MVYIPATLKRGGNFIEVGVGTNFGELDRIDFLRIVRDTLPANGFDNGIRVRLTVTMNSQSKQVGGLYLKTSLQIPLKEMKFLFK